MTLTEYIDLAETEGKFALWLETPGHYLAVMLAREFEFLRADYDRCIAPFARHLTVNEACAASRSSNLDVLGEMDLSLLETGVSRELWQDDEKEARLMEVVAFRLAEREMAGHKVALHAVTGFHLYIESDPLLGAYTCKGGLIMRRDAVSIFPNGMQRVQDGQHRVLPWRMRMH